MRSGVRVMIIVVTFHKVYGIAAVSLNCTDLSNMVYCTDDAARFLAPQSQTPATKSVMAMDTLLQLGITDTQDYIMTS